MNKRKTVAAVLATTMISSLIPTKNLTVQAENYQISTEKTEKNVADRNLVLDSVWDFEDCKEGTVLPEGFESILGSARIKEVDGNKVIELGGGSYPNVFIGDKFSGDLEFSARFKVVNKVDRGNVGLHIREQATDGKHGYATSFEIKDETNASLEVRKRVGQTIDPKKSVDLQLGDTKDWHTIGMAIEDKNVKVYFDEELKIEQELSGFDSGKVGIWSYLNTVYFDDITLKTSEYIHKEPVIDKEKVVLHDTNRDSAQFSITLNGNLLQQIILKDKVLKEGEDYTVTEGEGIKTITFTSKFLEALETNTEYNLQFEFGDFTLAAQIYVVSEDKEVKPINWEEMNTSPVEGTEDLQNFIQYIDKYIVNKWWNEKKNFDEQEGKEYLNLGGKSEHTIRPLAHQVRTLAASLKLNIYDEEIANVTEDEAREKAVLLVKSLAKSHKANDTSGWGSEWQSAFWAADVGQAGWMLWDELSAQDQEYIRAMVEYEANRFIGYKVPYYKDREGYDISAGDSKSEENSWNADLLMLAAVMMPEHENQKVWMSKAVELMLSAFSVPEDCTSEEIVNGFKLGKIMNGYNMESDGMVVNHGFVHPDYLSTIYQNVVTAVTCALGGVDTPKAALHNADIVYEAFVNYDLEKYNKPGEHIYVRDENGNATFNLVYPQGTDWGTDRQINFYLLDVMASGLGFDEKCEVKGEDWAKVRMPEMLRMQRRGSNGDLSNLTGEYYRQGDQDTYASREEWVSYHAISAYLSLWAIENGMVNITDEDYSNIKSENFTSVTLEVPNTIAVGKNVEAQIKPNKEIPYLDSSFATITYASSNPEVIEISQDGKMTAHMEGEADITVTVDFDGVVHSDTVSVEVYEEPNFDLAVYQQDFEDGKLPEEFNVLNGNWQVEQEDGNWILRQTGDKGGLFIGDTFDGNFAFEVKVRFVGNAQTYSGSGVYFREQGTEKDGYSVNIGQRSNSGNRGIEVRERSTKGGIVNSVFKNGEISRNVWHKLKVQVMGDTVKVFLDEEQVLENNYTTYPDGKIGLWSYKEKADFDDIKVFRNQKEYANISCTHSEGGTVTLEPDKSYIKKGEKLQISLTSDMGYYVKELLYNGKDVTSEIVDQTYQINDIQEDVDIKVHFAKVVDKSALESLIDYAKSQQAKDEYQSLVPVVKAAFEKALAEAEAVSGKADATQAEVDAAYDNLLKMVHMLDFTGNSKDLATLVNSAKGLNEKLFTKDSWDALQKALAAAEEVLADENALQEEIDAARDVLQSAMDSLVKIPVDKSKLQKLVDQSKKYEDAIKEYTPETAEIFKGALDYAREILAKEDATQEEIDAAYAALQNAIFGLRLIPNKDKLDELIQEAEQTDFSKYTEASGKAVKAALAHAKEVFADENATKEDVKGAEKELKAAMKELQLASTDGKDNNNNGNNGGNNNGGTSGNKTEKDAPKTGDHTSMAWLFAMAAAVGVVFFRRRKSYK